MGTNKSSASHDFVYRALRLEVAFPVSIALSQAEKRLEGLCVTLSERGIGVSIADPLQVGTKAEVTFVHPGEDHPTTYKARVVHEGALCGFVFEDLSEEECTRLRDLVLRLAGRLSFLQ